MEGENNLSENQFGFKKGGSTVDAIQAVVDIATNPRRGTGKRKGFCALVIIDIRVQYREMEKLHSRLPVADDGQLFYQQVGDLRGRKMVSQTRDKMWCPSRLAGGIIRVERHA